MGTFYSSIAVKGPSQQQLVDFFTERSRPTLISVAINGVATIFPVEFQRAVVVSYRFEVPAQYHRGETGWEPLVQELSQQFACIAFVVEVFDSDVFYYQLYDAGHLIDEYSCPLDYFGPFQSRTPAELNTFLLRSDRDHAALLCTAFGSRAVNDVARCLDQLPYYPFHDRMPAGELHRVLVDVLGLPRFAGFWSLGAAHLSRDADFGQGGGPAFVSTPPHWQPTWEGP